MKSEVLGIKNTRFSNKKQIDLTKLVVNAPQHRPLPIYLDVTHQPTHREKNANSFFFSPIIYHFNTKLTTKLTGMSNSTFKIQKIEEAQDHKPYIPVQPQN